VTHVLTPTFAYVYIYSFVLTGDKASTRQPVAPVGKAPIARPHLASTLSLKAARGALGSLKPPTPANVKEGEFHSHAPVQVARHMTTWRMGPQHKHRASPRGKPGDSV